MSKSFDVKVSFNFRAVFGEESLAEVGECIQKMRSASTLKPQGVALLDIYDEGGMEAALAFFIRDSVKQMKDLITEESDPAVFKNYSPFHAEITPRG